MSDRTTNLHELRELVREFVKARDWERFHSPKNLSMSLAIEAAELMEHFQWLTIDQSRDTTSDPQRRNDIAEEMSDVFCYLLALANELDIDLSDAMRDKMIKNNAKYPAEEFRGRFGPDDPGEGV